MDNSLIRYVSGQKRPRGQAEKALAQAGQPIYDETRVAALKVDGATALAGHAMEAVEQLDDHRKTLARGDEVKNQIMSDIELEALRQIKKIQSRLFNEFGCDMDQDQVDEAFFELACDFYESMIFELTVAARKDLAAIYPITKKPE